MSDLTHENVTLAGRHLPERHSEVVSAHERQTVELPGVYEIGALIEGAFIPIARLKAAEVLEAIDRARASQEEQEAQRQREAQPAEGASAPASSSPDQPQG